MIKIGIRFVILAIGLGAYVAILSPCFIAFAPAAAGYVGSCYRLVSRSISLSPRDYIQSFFILPPSPATWWTAIYIFVSATLFSLQIYRNTGLAEPNWKPISAFLLEIKLSDGLVMIERKRVNPYVGYRLLTAYLAICEILVGWVEIRNPTLPIWLHPT